VECLGCWAISGLAAANNHSDTSHGIRFLFILNLPLNLNYLDETVVFADPARASSVPR